MEKKEGEVIVHTEFCSGTPSLTEQHKNSITMCVLIISVSYIHWLLKALLGTNILNDVTAAPFSVSFSQLLAAKKHQKWCSCDVIKDIGT